MRRKFLLKIIGPNNEQREIPRGSIASVTWDDEQQGGWTSCSIETHVPNTALPTIQNGDEVWVFVLHSGNKELRYKGKIVRRSVSQETGTTLTLSCEGKSSDIRRTMLNRQYFLPGPPDMSVLFNAIAQDVIPKFPGVNVVTTPVGINKGIFEAFMMNFGDVADDIVRQSGNRSSWGVRGDINPPYTETLELRRNVSLSTILGVSGRGRVLALPQTAVSSSSGDLDATNIRNVLWLRGGPPVYPNLIQNSDFRLIEQTSAEVGNLILDPSFEDRSSNWTLANGASFKAGGLSEGATYHGDDMVLLDNNAEAVYQTRSGLSGVLLEGHTFRLEAYMRLKVGTGSGTTTLYIQWRNSGGSIIRTDSRDCVSTNAIWQNYALTATAPAGAAGFTVRADSVTPSMVVDSFALYDVSLVVARFLEAWCIGTSTVKTINWIQSAVRHPYRSAYAPEFAINVVASDPFETLYHVGTRNSADGGEDTFIDVTGNASYRFMMDAISPKAPLSGYYKNGAFAVRVQWYKTNNDSAGSDFVAEIISAGSGITEWTQYSAPMTAPADAVRARVSVVFKTGPTYSGGEQTTLGVDSTENNVSRIILASIGMRRSDAPSLPESRYYGLPAFGSGTQYEHIPDGPYQGVVSVTDVMDIGTDEYNSIEDYGEHPSFQDQSSVTNLSDLITFAKGFFTAYAVAKPTGSITVEGDSRYIVSSDGMRITGVRGRAVTGTVVAITKVSYTYNGQISYQIQWGGPEVDDPYTIFQMMIDERTRAGGLGAGGGYYGSSGSTSTGSSGSGATGAPGLPNTIKSEGTALPTRTTINFTGSGVEVTDTGTEIQVDIVDPVPLEDVVTHFVDETYWEIVFSDNGEIVYS